MQKRASWRELLDTIIQSRSERERIAAEAGINTVTLTRWASGLSTPRAQNIRRFLEAVPSEYRDQFRALLEEDSMLFSRDESVLTSSLQDIPAQLVHTVLETRAISAPHSFCWGIIHQILQHALLHLDPDRMGMRITIAHCMPPDSTGKIRSLREGVGLGTPPWEERFKESPLFLGAESLLGYALTTFRYQQVSDLRTLESRLFYYQAEHEVSAAACPIMFLGLVAGCVLFSSTQPGSFASPERSHLTQRYTNLIALAFREKEFYPTDLIELTVMPSPEEQQKHLAGFRSQLIKLLRDAAATQHPLSSTQAEQLVWQQIEEAILLDCSAQTM